MTDMTHASASRDRASGRRCAAALLLAGCTVGPDYVRPTAPTAAAYKESAGLEGRAAARRARRAATWWEVFGDARARRAR